MTAQVITHFLQERPQCRVALAAHQRPDGDAIGSAMGLAIVLGELGYHVRLVNAYPIPRNLTHLIDQGLCLTTDEPEWWRAFDCFGILDCGELGRLEEINRPAVDNLPTFTIDHHVTSDGLGQAIWVAPKASSTGEMVVTLCREAGWTLPQPAAQALWTAIISDTGRFSYENATPDSMEAARHCLLAGAAPAKAARELYQSVSIPERRLQTKVLERMEFHADNRLGLSWLRHADFVEAGIGVEGAQDLINLVRDTAGILVAIFLYEPDSTVSSVPCVKVSLRTGTPYSALDLVTRYGGGGHTRAAGGTLALPMEQAREKVLADALTIFFATGSA